MNIDPQSFGSNFLSQHHNHLSHNEMQCFNLRMINNDGTTRKVKMKQLLGLSRKRTLTTWLKHKVEKSGAQKVKV
jgi:hypothetical protein